MPQTSSDRAAVNHELRKLGFGGLDDPNLIPQIAFCIRDHAQFRGQLFSVEAEQRAHAYRALAPHLRFTPKPLDVYEAEMKERAEQQQLAIWDGSAYPKEFKVGEIESDQYRLERLAQDAIQAERHAKAKGVMELVCTRCTVAGRFPADTHKHATKDAYNEGWRRMEKNGQNKTYCPKHVPGRCSMTLQCSKCERKEKFRVWDEQDGMRDARRLGWTINESAVCPKCSAKSVLVQ